MISEMPGPFAVEVVLLLNVSLPVPGAGDDDTVSVLLVSVVDDASILPSNDEP